MPIAPILWTAFFVINFNVAMMIPLLPFIQKAFGLSPTEAGTVLAAFPVVALVANLALGPFIDRFGRKRFIVGGAAGCCVALLLTAASHSAGLIAACRGVTGLFMPMIGASIFAAIADYYPETSRARVAGYVTSATPIAFLCSLSMGVILGGLFSWQIPVVILAVICLLLAVVASRLPSTDPAALSLSPISRQLYRTRLLSLSPTGGTGALLAAYFFWAVGVYVFLGLYPSWLVQRGLVNAGVGTIGTVVFAGEIGGLFGAVFSGRLSGLFRSPLMLCAISALGIAMVVWVIPLASGMPVLQACAYAVFAFGRDLMLALILGDAMRLVAASARGSLNSSLNAIYQLGGSLGGMASAWLYGLRPDFSANVALSSMAFIVCAGLLWRAIAWKPMQPGHP